MFDLMISVPILSIMNAPIIVGILASILHVISGPDHLAAVTPLIIETKKKVWKIGIAWGIGHLLGMLLIGVLFVVFKDFIPIDTISMYSEKMVSVVLIGVGIWAFYRIFNEKREHNHPHVHTEEESYIHIHKHTHDHLEHKSDHAHLILLKQNIISSLGIGFIHGLAGIAHFILLLPVLGFSSKMDSWYYIIGFAIGTVVAMVAYAIILGKIRNLTKHGHDNTFFIGIRFAGGLFAIIIGIYWFFL